ncbi:MAG: hypothetical protein H8D58_01555 [Candidatus Marinimicrobia bacterium]|nr:hypothetical protein [Candidatus Neomarinimicrobiota bacterium]
MMKMITIRNGLITHDSHLDFGICHDLNGRTYQIEKRSTTVGKSDEAFKKRF